MKRPLRNRRCHRASTVVGCWLTLVALWPLFNGCLLWAQPVGQTVVAGQATFERQGALTTIRAGNNSIINYRSFDILANHTVQFIQPDASSRVLNRVIGDGPTSIFGNLLANGQVYIANPAGIYFGKGSYVNVGGLFAAAGRISDQDFMNHINRVTGMNGDVSNLGTIEAGSISLAGQHVANQGYLTSRNGLVTLLAGDEVLMGESGGSVFVNLGKAAPATGTGVENTGTIKAGSGRSILAAGDLYSLAVANSGTIEAREITLEGKGTGKVQASGTLDASDRSIGGVGGKIEVLGEKVAVSGAKLDASGDAGGGTVLVGGDFRGKGEARNASFTLVDRDSSIKADAISSGDGGKVAVWSDDTTEFHGTISAQAFGQTGDGGFAEISGKEHLALSGHANLSAANGANGHLLIDPGSVTIRGGGTNPPPASKDIFTDGWVIDQLNFGTDLTISTADSADGKAQDLTVDNTASISYNSSSSLTLIGNNSVTIDGLVNNSGFGNVTISGGQIKINAPVTLRLDVSGNRETPTVTLDGPVIGDGRVTANTLKLVGNGNVGSALQRLNTTVNSITLKKTGGDSYIDQNGGVNVFGVTGNGALNLQANGAITVTEGSIDGALVAGISAGSGDITLSSADDINFEDITAKSLTAHSGTDGTGNINFLGGRIGTRILADTQSYQAGTGTSGENGAFVQFRGGPNSIAPTFQDSTGQTPPKDFTHRQDATINDADIADKGQFGGTAPAKYTIQSDNGDLTLSTPDKVKGSALTLSAQTMLKIDAALDLASLNAAGRLIILAAPDRTTDAPSVRTRGGQIYGGPVSLQATTVLESTGGGDVMFNSTVNNEESLEVNTAGTTTFGGLVGDIAGLGPLETDNISAPSGSKGGNTVINATLRAHRVTFNDSVTLATAPPPSIGAVVPPSVVTVGPQTYNGTVTLAAPTVLESTDLQGYDIIFAATVNGAQCLTVKTPGVTKFGGPVNIASLTTDPGGRTDLNGRTVTTSGSQTYNDPVTLTENTILTGVGVAFNSTVDRDGTARDLTVYAGTRAATFAANIGAGAGPSGALGALTVNSSGVTTFRGSVNAASVTTDAGGRTDLNGRTVTTSGGQTYNDPVTLTEDTILTGVGVAFKSSVARDGTARDLTVNAGVGAAMFAANIGAGANDALGTLTVNSSDITTFRGSVNAASVTTDAGGRTDLNGGPVTTSGSQTYNDPVTLTANTILTGVGVAFNSTVDHDGTARDLTVNAGTGAATFAANIGAGAGPNGALGALNVNSSSITTFSGSVNAASVTTDAGGRTDLNGGSIASGTQTYNDDVILSANAMLTGTTVGFNGTVDAATPGGQSLTINTTGAIKFLEAVGKNTRLASISASGDRVTIADVSSTGSQDYEGRSALELTGTSLVASDGNINFNPRGNTENTRVATIFKTSSGNISIKANNFAMGQNEKFVSIGGGIAIDVSENAKPGDIKVGNLKVGDIAALGEVKIDSKNLTLQQREPVPSNPGDRGLDFLGSSISVNPRTPTFAINPDPDPKHVAIFGSIGLLEVNEIPGVSKISLPGPQPFVPQYEGNRLLDPVVPVPSEKNINLSEALGLVEPVPLEEAAQVVVSPAFDSYEKVFSDLSVTVLELRNTVGLRSPEAANLLDQIAAAIEFLRQKHKEWVADEDAREHNFEPMLATLVFNEDFLTTIKRIKQNLQGQALRLSANAFKFMKDQVNVTWGNRNVLVTARTVDSNSEFVKGYHVFYVPEQWWWLANEEKEETKKSSYLSRWTSFHSITEAKPAGSTPTTKDELGPGMYFFLGKKSGSRIQEHPPKPNGPQDVGGDGKTIMPNPIDVDVP